MEITKNMKAGYQGKRDAMRVKAEKLLNHPGKAKDVYYSKSCAEKEKVRPFKTGGHVNKHEKMESKKEEKMERCDMDNAGRKAKTIQKFAMGGVAKIRHEEATPQGLPKKFKKKSLREVL
ncbi:MAG: hypothetical protein ACRCX2_24820 [Paraclostridium sp.]|jgi:hypothetical protein